MTSLFLDNREPLSIQRTGKKFFPNLKGVYGYVYKIQNKENGKVYIGQTTSSPEKRKYQHKYELKNRKHGNAYLQHAFNKHGESSFKFQVISWFNSQKELNKAEIYYIKKYDALNHEKGYNIREGGNSGKLSLETRKKISVSAKGKKRSITHCKNLSKANKGKKHSAETRKKISESNKGKVFSAERKKNISNSLKGKKLSLKHRKKLSEGHKGQMLSANQRKRIRESLSGRSLFGFTGATYHHKKANPWTKVWCSLISYKKHRTPLGYFNDPLSANLVYNLVKEELNA